MRSRHLYFYTQVKDTFSFSNFLVHCQVRYCVFAHYFLHFVCMSADTRYLLCLPCFLLISYIWSNCFYSLHGAQGLCATALSYYDENRKQFTHSTVLSPSHWWHTLIMVIECIRCPFIDSVPVLWPLWPLCCFVLCLHLNSFRSFSPSYMNRIFLTGWYWVSPLWRCHHSFPWCSLSHRHICTIYSVWCE